MLPHVLAWIPHKLQSDILEVLYVYHESESQSVPMIHVLFIQTHCTLADYSRKKNLPKYGRDMLFHLVFGAL